MQCTCSIALSWVLELWSTQEIIKYKDLYHDANVSFPKILFTKSLQDNAQELFKHLSFSELRRKEKRAIIFFILFFFTKFTTEE